jgi:hypothetical protein
MRIRLLAFAAILCAAGCDDSSSKVAAASNAINSCTDLADAYTSEFAYLCDAGLAGSSRYCSTCIGEAGLASYTITTPGTCVCQPLVLTPGPCAATIDDESLLQGIRAADQECTTYVLQNSAQDAGTDG